MPKISHPFGPADVQSLAYAATIAATITNAKTILNVAQMTGAATLNLTIDPDLQAGAELLVKCQSDGTARDLTPGTGMTGTAIAGAISKTKYASYVYDGSTFVHVGTQQVN